MDLRKVAEALQLILEIYEEYKPVVKPAGTSSYYLFNIEAPSHGVIATIDLNYNKIYMRLDCIPANKKQAVKELGNRFSNIQAG